MKTVHVVTVLEAIRRTIFPAMSETTFLEYERMAEALIRDQKEVIESQRETIQWQAETIAELTALLYAVVLSH